MVITDKKVTRNMKKMGEQIQEIAGFALGGVKKGMMLTGKGEHAVAYSERHGVTYTSKKQSDSMELWGKDGSHAYAQVFENNKFSSIYPDIKNDELKKLLCEKAESHVLMSIKLIEAVVN